MADEFVESPDTIHGRLLESVHITGYTMGRACMALEWLLEDDRWKTIGSGFEDGEEFMATIDIAQFKIAADKRKRLVKLISGMVTEKPATQRTIATALGVNQTTVHNDLKADDNSSKPENTRIEKPASDDNSSPPTPPPEPSRTLSSSGEEVIVGVEKKAGLAQKKEDRETKKLEPIALPDGIYQIIYADPPWKYTSGDPHGESIQNTILDDHYQSKSIQELCDLPVESMCHDDTVLFMWTTSPLLEEAFDVIRAWGFKYKTSMVWDKVKHNVGHYVSVRHEFLLICTKGSFTPQVKKLHDSVYSEARTIHSKKPEWFRSLIDEIYPVGKRIELFARERADGWDAWGNEA